MTSRSVRVQVLVPFVPGCTRHVNGLIGRMAKTNLTQIWGTKNWPCLARGNSPWMTCWRDSMVLVLLLDLRYTSSVFSMTSERKCSLNSRLSNTESKSSNFLLINVELPQGISEVVSGLPNKRSTLQRSRIKEIPYLATEVRKLCVCTISGHSQEKRGARRQLKFSTIHRSRTFRPFFRQLA